MIDDNAINLVLLGLRLSAAAVMLAHGINHIYGGGKIAGTGRWFESLGMKPGPLARVAGQPHRGRRRARCSCSACSRRSPRQRIIGVMLVAIVTNHRGNGFFIFRPGEGWEYVMTLTVVGFVIATIGPGDWSLDQAIGLDEHYTRAGGDCSSRSSPVWEVRRCCSRSSGGRRRRSLPPPEMAVSEDDVRRLRCHFLRPRRKRRTARRVPREGQVVRSHPRGT